MLISILTYHVSVHSLSYWYIFVALSICCNSSETLLWHNFDYHASFTLPIFALTNHRSSRSKFIFICVNFQRNYSAINRVATFTSPQKKNKLQLHLVNSKSWFARIQHFWTDIWYLSASHASFQRNYVISGDHSHIIIIQIHTILKCLEMVAILCLSTTYEIKT